jgi:hypothetical protein
MWRLLKSRQATPQITGAARYGAEIKIRFTGTRQPIILANIELKGTIEISRI